MPIDHLLLRIPADQFDETIASYTDVLAPLDYKKLMDRPGFVGFGEDKPEIFIMAKGDEPAGIGLHVSFTAKGTLGLGYAGRCSIYYRRVLTGRA